VSAKYTEVRVRRRAQQKVSTYRKTTARDNRKKQQTEKRGRGENDRLHINIKRFAMQDWDTDPLVVVVEIPGEIERLPSESATQNKWVSMIDVVLGNREHLIATVL
jgi:hypothetical protein